MLQSPWGHQLLVPLESCQLQIPQVISCCILSPLSHRSMLKPSSHQLHVCVMAAGSVLSPQVINSMYGCWSTACVAHVINCMYVSWLSYQLHVWLLEPSSQLVSHDDTPSVRVFLRGLVLSALKYSRCHQSYPTT